MPALAEIVSALLLSLVLAALGVAVRWNKVRNSDLMQARRHRDRFFTAAEQLVTDQRTPEDLARIVMLLASGMTRKLSLYLMLVAPKPGRTPDMVVKLDDLPDDLRERALRALMDAICTLTYQSVLFGPVIRRRLCLDDNRPERQRRNSGGRSSDNVQELAGKVARYELRHAHAA